MNNIPTNPTAAYNMLSNAQRVITCPSCSKMMRVGSEEHINHEHRTTYTSATYHRVHHQHPQSHISRTYDTTQQLPILYHVVAQQDPTHIYATIEYIPANSSDELAPFYKGSAYKTVYADRILFANNLADILRLIETASLDTAENLLINNWS